MRPCVGDRKPGARCKPREFKKPQSHASIGVGGRGIVCSSARAAVLPPAQPQPRSLRSVHNLPPLPPLLTCILNL